MFDYCHNGVDEVTRVTAFNVIEDSFAEGVVHDGIKLVAEKIAPFNSVAFLICSVLPHFTDNKFILAYSLYGFAEIIEELVREFIGNVETEACRPLFQPVVNDTLLSADELGIVLIVFVYVGESVDTPPSLVDIGVVDEAVPVVVFAVLRLISAGFGVSAVLVEIDAVSACMRENTVKDNGYTEFFCFLAEFGEVLIRTEEGVDFGIIGGIVPMILMCLENGVEVYTRNAEVVEIRQFFLYTCEVAAEVIVVPYVTITVGRVPRSTAPVLAQNARAPRGYFP